jgi:hypothetical protein
VSSKENCHREHLLWLLFRASNVLFVPVHLGWIEKLIDELISSCCDYLLLLQHLQNLSSLYSVSDVPWCWFDTLWEEICASLLPFDLQANLKSNIPKEPAKVHKTKTSNVKQNNNANMSTSLISLHQLNAHAKCRAWKRREPV